MTDRREEDRLREERLAVLASLRSFLWTIGSANDAQDHGSVDEAERMRRSACEDIGGPMAEHAFLMEMFPKLEWELESGHILGFGWSSLSDDLDAYVDVLSRRPERAD
jgi:hypothetical protein